MPLVDQSSRNTIYLTFKNLRKPDEAPYIEAYHGPENITKHMAIVGELVKINFGEGEYEKKKFPTVELILKDEDTTYKLRCGMGKWTGIMRTLLNSLLSLESYDNLNIAIFGKKDEWKNVSVKQNDEKVDWFLSLDEQKEFKETVTFKGETQTDYTKLENKLKELCESKINAILSITHKNEPKPSESIPKLDIPNEEHEQKESISNDLPDFNTEDELPF
jgi:hypothetical protein